MKKYLFLFSFLLVTMAINAQNGINEEIIETTLSKNVMWINLKKWVSSTFNSYKYVVDLEDKESGALILKWSANIPDATTTNTVIATAEGTMQIDVRDNKYRIRKSDEYISIKVANFDVKRMSNSTLRTAMSEMETISSEFKKERMSVEELNKSYSSLIKDICLKHLLISNELTSSLKKQMIYVDDF